MHWLKNLVTHQSSPMAARGLTIDRLFLFSLHTDSSAHWTCPFSVIKCHVSLKWQGKLHPRCVEPKEGLVLDKMEAWMLLFQLLFLTLNETHQLTSARPQLKFEFERHMLMCTLYGVVAEKTTPCGVVTLKTTYLLLASCSCPWCCWMRGCRTPLSLRSFCAWCCKECCWRPAPAPPPPPRHALVLRAKTCWIQVYAFWMPRCTTSNGIPNGMTLPS